MIEYCEFCQIRKEAAISNILYVFDGIFRYGGENMSYVALYRKYRPNTFDKILGQENVTEILKNQVKTGKISHAYIFSGSRGTGKTSAAKVFARAINCLNPKDGQPCNECSVCKAILNGSVADVIEMDAASNNSVDDIRQIKQEVAYATVDVKYRVYIIDEAHMLSTSAFNALLKTIEEPPENVVFILATTEQNKIPVTILSRCLRFEFNRLTEKDIIKELTYVLEDQKIKFEPEALSYIAKAADGGMRDALSILDRCLSENYQNLTLKSVENIIGIIDTTLINTLTQAILNYDSITALEQVNNVINNGKSLRDLVSRLTESFLNILIETTKIKSEKIDNSRLIHIIDRLSGLDNKLKNSTQPEIQLKSDIVALCNISDALVYNNQTNQASNDNINNNYLKIIDDLSNKVSDLESKLNDINEKINNIEVNDVTLAASKLNIENKINQDSISNQQNNKENNKEIVANTLKNGDTMDFSKYQVFKEGEKFANSFLVKGEISLYSAFLKAKFYYDDSQFIISTPIAYSYNKLSSSTNILQLQQMLKQKFNMDKKVKVILDSVVSEDSNTNDIENVITSQKLSGEVNIIDQDKDKEK